MDEWGTDAYGRPIVAPAADAQGVQLVIDQVEVIARDELPGLRDQVAGQFDGSCAGFRHTHRDPGLFGSSENGFVLGFRAQAAYEVFTATIDALIGDLEQDAARLRESLRANVDADESAEIGLRRILHALDNPTSMATVHSRVSAQNPVLGATDSTGTAPGYATTSGPVDSAVSGDQAAPTDAAGASGSQGRQTFESGA